MPTLTTQPDAAVRVSSPEAAPAQPRVVLFLDHTSAWSGGEIALWRTLEALDRQQVRPLVLLASDGPLVEKLRDLGIETHLLPLSAQVRELRKEGRGVGALRELRALLASGLASALEFLLMNRSHAAQLGAAGYQSVRRHFTAAPCARKIEQVYRALVPATSSHS